MKLFFGRFFLVLSFIIASMTSIPLLSASENCTALTTKKSEKQLIYISVGYWPNLLSFDNPVHNRDGCLEPFRQFFDAASKAGYEVRQTDYSTPLEDFKYLIVFEIFPNQIKIVEKYPKEKLILFLWEPPSVLPQNYDPQYHKHFSKIYTWNDALVDNKKYFKFYYPAMHPMIENPIAFESKKLCTMVCCNKSSTHPDELYGERREVIKFYESLHPTEFDLYGAGWPHWLKVYKGLITLKVNKINHYKFSYTYENIKGVPGYITEKIFECLNAGSIPIYMGASNITTYIPQNCFIARDDFASNEQLYDFMKNMTKEQYQQYIDNIRAYTNSDKAKLYSPDNFVKIMMDLITSN